MRHSPTKRVLAAALLIVAGFGCTNQPRNAGEACAVTRDCRTELVCLNNVCAAVACPSDAPIDCGDTLPGMCCPRDTPFCCAHDGSCYNTAAACAGTSCMGELKSCTTSGNCCTDLTCARFGHFCQVAKDLALGDACKASAQCKSALCSDYCTKRCSSNNECDRGIVNTCLDTDEGFRCVPTCTKDTDCSVFGPNVTCQSAMDPGGLPRKGCFAR